MKDIRAIVFSPVVSCVFAWRHNGRDAAKFRWGGEESGTRGMAGEGAPALALVGER